MKAATAAFTCQETIWSHRGPEPGTFVRGHTAPCPNRARYRVTDPASGRVTLLCGSCSNKDHWANYPDFRWEDL